MAHMSREEFVRLKPGNIVTVRKRIDMEKEFGDLYHRRNPAKFRVAFNNSMNYLCGKTWKVRTMGDDTITLEGGNVGSFGYWVITEQMLESTCEQLKDEEMPSEWDELIFGGIN